MKRKLFWNLTLLLFFVSLPCLGSYRTIPPWGLSVSALVNNSLLVFTGRVVDMEFVYRENIPIKFTTDITVKVEEMIKGEPNAGEDLVKFFYPGGEGIDPETGKRLKADIVGLPEFKKGEKVLMFLRKHKYLADKRPYGGLIFGDWGKREIQDDGWVSMPYIFKEQLFYNDQWNEVDMAREILLPLDLALQIAKAAVKDAKATEAVEEQIREFAQNAPIVPRQMPRLDQVLVNVLEVEVQKILVQKEKEGLK